MSESIKEAVPKILKTLWDLRGAAQNSVVFPPRRGKETPR